MANIQAMLAKHAKDVGVSLRGMAIQKNEVSGLGKGMRTAEGGEQRLENTFRFEIRTSIEMVFCKHSMFRGEILNNEEKEMEGFKIQKWSMCSRDKFNQTQTQMTNQIKLERRVTHFPVKRNTRLLPTS